LNADTNVREAAADLGQLCRTNEPLGPMTTYKVGGCAAIFVAPRSLGELSRSPKWCVDTDCRPW